MHTPGHGAHLTPTEIQFHHGNAFVRLVPSGHLTILERSACSVLKTFRSEVWLMAQLKVRASKWGRVVGSWQGECFVVSVVLLKWRMVKRKRRDKEAEQVFIRSKHLSVGKRMRCGLFTVHSLYASHRLLLRLPSFLSLLDPPTLSALLLIPNHNLSPWTNHQL